MSRDSSALALVLEGMNPTVRAIMFSVLAFPVSIAISGLILQVNVGNLITKYADYKLAQVTMPAPSVVPQYDHSAIEDWICQHKQAERPEFCE